MNLIRPVNKGGLSSSRILSGSWILKTNPTSWSCCTSIILSNAHVEICTAKELKVLVDDREPTGGRAKKLDIKDLLIDRGVPAEVKRLPVSDYFWWDSEANPVLVTRKSSDLLQSAFDGHLDDELSGMYTYLAEWGGGHIWTILEGQWNGFEGRTDWPLIKRMHNQRIRDRAVFDGDFNILGTTNMDPVGEETAHKYPKWSALGRKPRGEKGNEDRYDTLVVAELKKNKFTWRTDLGNGKGKDRGGRELVKDVDFTDQGFVQSYYEFHELGA